MSSVQKRGIAWVKAGLISQEQLEAIEAFEAKESHGGLIYWLGWLAAISIVLGLIALIAANWEMIPPLVKVLAYAFSYGAVAYAVVGPFKDRPVISEVIKLFLMAYTFAGIGLIAQIYHLHSAPYKGIFFWSALTFGIMIQCREVFASLAWLILSYVGFLMLLESLKVSSSTHAMIACGVVGILACIGSAPRRFEALRPLQDSSFALANVVAFAYSASLFSFIFGFSMTDKSVFVVALLSLTAWAAFVWKRADWSLLTRKTYLFYLASLAFQWTLYTFLSEAKVQLPGLGLFTTLLFAFSTLMLSLAAFSRGKARLFECLIVTIPLQFFLVYARHFFSSFMSGFGFIAFGLVILIALVLWQKNKERVFQRLEEELKRV